MKSKLKQVFFALIGILLISSCQLDNEITTKSVIGVDKLTESISNNEQFKLFANKHYDNLSLLSSLSQNDHEVLKSKLSSLMRLKEAEAIRVLLDEYNFNSEALTHFVNLKTYLDERFLYSQSDFIKALTSSCEGFKVSLNNTNGRTAWYINMCSIHCIVASTNYRDQWIAEGTSSTLAGAMGNAYYLGCTDGCNYQ